MSDSDRLDVHAVLTGYGAAVDRKDFEAVARCFTPEAQASFMDGAVQLDGRDEIIGFLQGLPNQKSTTHFILPVEIDVEGDRARATCYAMSYVVVDQDGEDRLKSRAIRYEEELEKRDGRWAISDFRHRCEFEVEGTVAFRPN